MKILTITIFLILTLQIVSASASFGIVTNELNLFEKNPNTWQIVDNGAYGKVIFSRVITPIKGIAQARIRYSAWKLEPKTEYQLIYYGSSDEVYNNVWNYATCIGLPRRTSTQGYFNGGSSNFAYPYFFSDNIHQKIWIVLKSDVKCESGRMINWQPTKYLFEENTI